VPLKKESPRNWFDLSRFVSPLKTNGTVFHVRATSILLAKTVHLAKENFAIA
jgi:hypothetical protein